MACSAAARRLNAMSRSFGSMAKRQPEEVATADDRLPGAPWPTAARCGADRTLHFTMAAGALRKYRAAPLSPVEVFPSPGPVDELRVVRLPGRFAVELLR